PQRHALHLGLLLDRRHAVPARAQARAQGQARRDRIDVDAEGAELQRELAREGDDAALGGGVGGAAAGAEPASGDRRDVHDLAGGLALHDGHDRVAEQEGAGEVEVQQALPVGERQLVDGRGWLADDRAAADDGIGNGRAAAILLAKAGARVVVADRDLKLARRTVEMIESISGQAIAVEVDVTRSADCAAMVKTAVERFGRLDVLDNNVGIGSRGSVVDLGEDEWRRVMQVNVETMFLVAKHAIPAMKRAGGGAIVNVSSISALRPRGLTAYTASKGAVIALTRAMAVDHGRDGIRVNCVAPGPVYTPMVYAAGMSDAARAQRRDASVLGIEGTGWDTGLAVRFLLSSQARYITGQTLAVDGGTTLTAPERDSQ